jgi:hypothetical protein
MLNAFRTQERSKKNIGKYLVHKKGLKKYWPQGQVENFNISTRLYLKVIWSSEHSENINSTFVFEPYRPIV